MHSSSSGYLGIFGLWDIDGNIEVWKLDWVVGSGQVGFRVAPNSEFDRIPNTEYIRSWRISEYRIVFVHEFLQKPNTE